MYHLYTSQRISFNKMFYASLSILATFLLLIGSSGNGNSFALADSLENTLKKLKIYPDILDTNSYNILNIELANNQIKPGDVVPARNLRELKPEKISWDASENYRYTLMLLDLDRNKIGSISQSPATQYNNTALSIYNHYTNINIQGSVISSGQAVVGFDQPVVPCSPSTRHRILALALEQHQVIDLTSVSDLAAVSGQYSKRRENLQLKDVMSRHRLTIVAVNAFLASGDHNGTCSAASNLMPSFLIQLSASLVPAILMLSYACRRQNN